MQQSSNPFPYNIFRLPSTSNKEESTLISLHDASGSMSSVWKHNAETYNKLIENIPHVITTTFSNDAARTGRTLTQNIYDYNCSGTNIESAFKLLINILETEKFVSKNITIIFISDGQDSQSNIQSRLNNLKPKLVQFSKQFTISFICVGVGSGFPTFLAMDLREMLHSGDSTIPPVFLVDTQQGLASFEQNYSQLVDYVNQSEKLDLSSSVIQYPWTEEQIKIGYAGQLVLAPNSIEVLRIEKTEIQLFPEEQLTPGDVLNLGVKWMSVLQLQSLKKNVGKEAEKAIYFIDQLFNKFLSQQPDQNQKLSVMKRIKIRQYETQFQPIYNLKSQLKSLIDQSIGELNEAQAAKRLAIGTQIGKYHKVAQRFCGISVDDFRQIRDDAVQILSNLKVNYQESDQEQSIYSLQNTKDVLAEEDLINAIKQCDDQFDVVNVVPLIGIGVNIKRFDGALVNIWLTEVQSVARVHSTIDTISLYQTKDKQVELKIGNDEAEIVNVVLPLFGTKDLDLTDFIRTRFFNVLMTFNVIHNVDTCFDTSHASLSANVLHYLITQDNSSWRDELIKKILFNFHMKYAEEEEFNNMKTQMLSQNPQLALTNENPSLTFRCEDPSKALINLLDLINRQSNDIAPNIDRIAQHYVCEALARQIKTFDQIEGALINQKLTFDQSRLDHLVDKLALILEGQIQQKLGSVIELRHKVSDCYSQLDLLEGIQIEQYWNPNLLTLPNTKYSIQNLKKIYLYLTGRHLDDSLLQCILIHAWRYKNSFERNQILIQQDSIQAYSYLLTKSLTDIYTRKNLTDSLISKHKEKFLEYSFDQVGNVHVYITPMKKHLLLKTLKNDKDLFQKLHYYKRLNIFKHSCMCPGCPSYLQPNGPCEAMEHPRSMYLILLNVKQNCEKPLNEILDILYDHSKIRSSMIIEPMIEHLKEAYLNLKYE